MKKVIESLRSPLQAIKTLASRLQNEEDIELGHQPDTGILCLRLRPKGIPESQLDKMQNDVYMRILEEGRRAISITRLDGQTYLRFVAISPLVTAGALMETVTIARRYAQDFRNS
jgi:glutamate/tyrosine decarboxylase-like PLP-dependent enzyme